MNSHIQSIINRSVIGILVAIILYLIADTFLPNTPTGTIIYSTGSMVAEPVPTWTNTGYDSGVPLVATGETESATGDTVACTMEYLPVCASDKKTYSNACVAKSQGVEVVSEGECPKEVTSTDTPPVLSPSSSTTPPVSGEVIIFGSGTHHLYNNTALGFGFALPKYTYYQGYGSRDGASNSLAVSLTSTGTDDFTTAPVRVFFYKSSISPQVQGVVIPVENGKIVVQAENASDAKIAKILETIQASAR